MRWPGAWRPPRQLQRQERWPRGELHSAAVGHALLLHPPPPAASAAASLLTRPPLPSCAGARRREPTPARGQAATSKCPSQMPRCRSWQSRPCRPTCARAPLEQPPPSWQAASLTQALPAPRCWKHAHRWLLAGTFISHSRPASLAPLLVRRQLATASRWCRQPCLCRCHTQTPSPPSKSWQQMHAEGRSRYM